MANIKLLWHCGEAGWKTRRDYKAISPTASQPAATSQPPAAFYERREGRRREGEEGEEREKGREVRGKVGEEKRRKDDEKMVNVEGKWDDWRREGMRASRWANSKKRRREGDGGRTSGAGRSTAAQHPPPFTQPLQSWTLTSRYYLTDGETACVCSVFWLILYWV